MVFLLNSGMILALKCQRQIINTLLCELRYDILGCSCTSIMALISSDPPKVAQYSSEGNEGVVTSAPTEDGTVL